MKFMKKKVFVVAVAVSLIAILSMGTLAWFTAKDEVTNTFKVATSTDTEPEDIFSVSVSETTPGGNTDGYEYTDVLPGDELTKVVTVENTGYYDQYIRATVTVSDAAAWMAVLGVTDAPSFDQIVSGFDSNVWVDVTGEVVGTDIVYTMYYNGILDGDDDGDDTNVVTVFDAVKIPESMTVEQAADFEHIFEINVVADAVQTENLGIDPSQGDGAKAAFEAIR